MGYLEMNKPQLWDAQRHYREIKRWIKAVSPSMWADSKLALEAVLRKTPQDVEKASISFAYSSLALCHGYAGLLALMDNKTNGLERLYQAVYCDECDLVYTGAHFFALPGEISPFYINENTLSLARAMYLGCTREAQQMAEVLWKVKADTLVGFTKSNVVPFIFHLYSQWQNRPLSKYMESLPLNQIYADLLQVWQSEDLALVEQSLLAACDYHLARSNTRASMVEFSYVMYALQPVEILAVLRLREMSGLAIPVLDHPLMNTPVSQLSPLMHVEPDPLLYPALDLLLTGIERDFRVNFERQNGLVKW